MVKICCDIVKNKLYLIKSTKLCTITCTKKQKCDNELKKQVQNAAMCDFPRMSGCNSGKILYNGMSGIFCSQQNDIGQERQNVMEYARIGNRRMLL